MLDEARLLERDHRAEARRVVERLRAEEPSTLVADTSPGSRRSPRSWRPCCSAHLDRRPAGRGGGVPAGLG
ncbi:hypothetical protein K7G98_10280 [Saccharothrix sp. MB29]|nr:hypothetical protein [Saccharothrix sp. MB29]